MQNIYAIYDKVAKAITGPLWLYNNDAAAIRVFDDVAREPKSIIGQHPGDYNLVNLGDLNEQKPEIKGQPAETVLEGSQWLALNQKSPATE